MKFFMLLIIVGLFFGLMAPVIDAYDKDRYG